MAYVKNDNSHGVRVGRTRIPAGGVAEVSDEDAKVFDSYEGVENSSQADYEEYRKQDRIGGGSPSRAAHERMKLYRHAHRAESVSAPLQVVVGDDDAPYGPPSGTVTTKQLEAEKGVPEKRAFADHEHIEVPEGASEIEQKQAENVRAVEEVARALAEEMEGGGDDDDGDADVPEPPKSRSKPNKPDDSSGG